MRTVPTRQYPAAAPFAAKGVLIGMNPRQLHYIQTIAQEQSISAAAKKLYVSQPSLSALVKRVEEELGCELFDRTVTPLRLTSAGEIYIETVQEMLKLNQNMKNRLRDIDENPNGKLSVGVWPNIGIMPLVMKRFFEAYPKYDVELKNSQGEGERLRLLEKGDIELCIQPIYGKLSSKFAVEEIGTDSLVLVVPSEFEVNRKIRSCHSEHHVHPVIEPSELQLLSDVPLVLLDGGMRLRTRIDLLFEQVGLEPHVKMTSQKVGGCLDMAKYGVCATLMPSSLVKYRVASSKVMCYEIHQDESRDVIGAIYVKDRYLSKAARDLIDIMKQL